MHIVKDIDQKSYYRKSKLDSLDHKKKFSYRGLAMWTMLLLVPRDGPGMSWGSVEGSERRGRI